MPAPPNDVPATQPAAQRSRLVVVKKVLRIIFGIGFIAAGISHFVIPDHFVKTIPPYLPAHEVLNIVAGVAATILGALLLWPATTRYGAWGLIVFLLAVFPSNIHMATHADQYPQFPETILWLRLPLQTMMITVTYWLSKR